LNTTPLFSVLVPVYKPEPDHFRSCVESVLNQRFGRWELCLVADGPQPEEIESLLNIGDERVKVLRRETNGGISAATQDALVLATGEFIALLDHDDLLSDRSLERVAEVLGEDGDIDMLYTDEDKIDPIGERVDPFFKPGYSPERLRTQMYTGHLGVFRRQLVHDVGGFRSGFDGSQDHDLALRVAERARAIAHLPEVLYHWRQTPTSTALDAASKDWAFEAGRRAVQSHLDRTEFPATAHRNPHNPGVLDLEPQAGPSSRVSVIIPTGGGQKVIHGMSMRLVDNAVSSLLGHTSVKDLEIVVVLDANSEEDLGPDLESMAPGIVRAVRDTRPFNFSASCNLGAVSSLGDVLIFLNDDTESIQDRWIERLVMYATRPDIGAVGAKLLYGDERIQHAGVWSRHGGPGHRYPGFRRDHPGHMGSLWTAQNCMAVTGACLGVERRKFEEVGGFSQAFPLNFNDVDLCLKLVSRGYRSVVDCGTEVVHHESATRNPAVKEWEYLQLRERWSRLLSDDFWDNPNHTGHGVQEFPATSESLLQTWEALGLNAGHARIWKEGLPSTL
jgi:GT2 family glycosyltransferase